MSADVADFFDLDHDRCVDFREPGFVHPAVEVGGWGCCHGVGIWGFQGFWVW